MRQRQVRRGRAGREARLASAMERQKQIEGLGPAARLTLLDERLGEGQGATRERARLNGKSGKSLTPTGKRKRRKG